MMNQHTELRGYRGYASIVDSLKALARTKPDQVAFCYVSYGDHNVREETVITYGQLDEQARKVAAYMQKLGLAGERAILLYPGGIDFITVFYGCLYAKVIAVPLYHYITKRKSDRVFTITEDSEAVIFCTGNKNLNNVRSFVEKNLPGKTYNWFTMDQLEVVQAGDYREEAYQADDVAYLQYTSGSTSAPKGVMITHNNIMHNMGLTGWHFNHSAQTVGVSWIPHYHDMGLIDTILQPVYYGYKQVNLQPTDFITKPYEFLKAVDDYRGTAFCMPNFAFEHCVDHITEEERRTLDLSCVDTITNGAEPCYWSTMKLFLDTFKECGIKEDAIYPAWGLAESTLVVTGRNPDPASRPLTVIKISKEQFEQNRIRPAEPGESSIDFCSVGRPKACTKIVIANPDTLASCPKDTVGEVWMANESVSPGYWRNEQATKEIFEAYLSDCWEGPFLRTGDLGFIHDGFLYICGRLKDVVIIHGVNYYPNDIEFTAAHCHPALVSNSCAAFAVTVNRQESLFIIQEVKRTAAHHIDPEELCDRIRWEVAEVHGLQVFGIVLLRYGQIYKTSSGKIQRKLCHDRYLSGELVPLHESLINEEAFAEMYPKGTPGASKADDPETVQAGVEGELIARIAALVKCQPGKIQPAKSLISLGLDSLSVTLLKQAIRDQYACSVDISTLFGTNVTKLARHIAGHLAASPPPPPQQQGAEAPLLVAHPAGQEEPFPLTDLQAAYWMGRNEGFELGGVAAHAYMEVTAANMDLDHERLNRSLGQMIMRHPMLRAVITGDGQQRILADAPEYKIIYRDMTRYNPEEQTLECLKIREELSHQVIATDSWPWFEIRHSKLGSSKSIIHISIDLLIADIWSMNLLFQEWFQLYGSSQATLPQVEITFRDYCLALDSLKTTEEYKQAETYWTDRVNTLPPAPPLPLCKAPKDLEKIRFCQRSHTLPVELWGQMKAMAQEHGVTPSVVLMAAFSKVLGLWSRASRFSLNLTLFNRRALHEDIDRLIGDFTSVLVLEVDNGQALSLAGLARSLQQRLARDMEHSSYSGVNVIRQMAKAWGKSPQETVLPVVFTSALSNDGPMFFHSGHASFGETTYLISQTPQVWLDHQVFESEDQLVIRWDAVDELFPPAMLNDMFQAYTGLVEQLAVKPALWEQELRSLLPMHQKQRRVEYNHTPAPVPEELLYSSFLRNAAEYPQAPAVLTSDRSITYKELLGSSSYLASQLRYNGIRPNDLAAISMDKGWEQIVAVMGIVMSGGAYVCIDPGLPLERKQYVLEHCGAKLVLVQNNKTRLSDMIEHIIINEAILAEQACKLDSIAQSDDLAYVLYTSGSTGLPKGVSITHRGALNTILDVNRRFEVTRQDRVLALSSLSFDLSVYDIFGMLHAGGAIVLPDPHTERNPDHWIEMVQRHQVTVWNSVPSLMEMLVETLEVRERKLTLNLVMMSGDWIPMGLTERIWQIDQSARVISLGGATEASIWSIYYPVQFIDSTWSSIPYGRPLGNQSFYVLNLQMGDCPDWVLGDLYIGGIGLALNYWKDPSKTEQAFINHPVTGERIYKTGDLGRFHPDGYIEFMGREDFQIKLGGFRIELGEIETVLSSHPKVRRGVVKKVERKDGNAMLAAYVVLNTLGKLELAKSAASSAPTGQQRAASDTDIIIGDEPEIIKDTRQRLLFKLQNKGLRPENPSTPELRVELAASEQDLEAYSKRSSSRRFVGEPMGFNELSMLLECLSKAELDGLSRFRYGSAGGLYPVQTYVMVKEDRVAGLNRGMYYYHPFHHELLYLGGAEEMGSGVHVAANQAICESSAFTIFLVGKLSAIRPLYGDKARDFCLIEAGLMTQLLEQTGVGLEIGLCQVGALADEAAVRRAIGLDEDHLVLHVLLGGKADYCDSMRGMQPGAEDNWSTAHPSELVRELRDYCSRKLPHYMVPAWIEIMEELPLSPVGKVNYRALPEPSGEAEAPREAVIPTSDEMERLIAGIIQVKSGITGVLDPYKSFFDLGVNSLTITRAWRDMITATGIEFPVVRIFENPTISGIAAYLNRLKQEPEGMDTDTEAMKEKADKQRAALLKRRSRISN